jgi:hypothetical protein
MATYKSQYFSVTCNTCGTKFDREIAGISASDRREKAGQEQECKTCYAKRQPKKAVIIEIGISRIPKPTVIVKVLNSFDVKETLKENGYSFDQDGKLWKKEILAGSSTQELLANFAPEKNWLTTQGWEIAKDSITQKLMA